MVGGVQAEAVERRNAYLAIRRGTSSFGSVHREEVSRVWGQHRDTTYRSRRRVLCASYRGSWV